MGKRKVKINVLNWDATMYHDLMTEEGFIISDPAQISIDGQSKKTEFGPQSPRFGTTYGDDQEFIERYRCKCGKFRGKLYKGEICPECKSEVIRRDVDVKQTAWINFGRYKFINPYYYQVLIKLIGKKVFPDIIDMKQRVDVNGHVSNVDISELKESYSPFSGIGIQEFMVRFDEIISYFQSKKKDKADELEELKKLKPQVFTSNCPVYTTLLRPQSSTSDTLYYTGIDKEINPLIRLSLDIENCEPIELPLILSNAQSRVNKMWEYNFQLINSKEGFIRDKLLGGSLNFSARNVITPD